MSKLYLVMESVNVSSATSTSTPFTSAFPALTNFLGLSESLRYLVNSKLKENLILDSEISVVVNSQSYQAHHPKFSRYRFEDKSKAKKGENASIVDEKMVDLNLNLYIKFDLKEDLTILDIDDIKSILSNKKFDLKVAGGVAIPQKYYFTTNIKDIFKSLKQFKKSFILQEANLDFNNPLVSYEEKVKYLKNNNDLFLQTGFNTIKDETGKVLGDPIFNFVGKKMVASFLTNENHLEQKIFFRSEYNNNKSSCKLNLI